jgi:hypothetical protein
MLRASMKEKYIKYVECSQRLWVRPDPDTKFAESCIDKLDALNIASSAGFYDENGRAWTLSKQIFRGGFEIFVKCVEPEGEKNVVKFAWIYPASHTSFDDKKDVVPVFIGDWVVQVAF